MNAWGLTVVIPARNEDLMPYTVRRLRDSRQGVPLQIIVIEDGSGRDYGLLPQPSPGCEMDYIRLAGPVGLCFGRDMGIAAAKYETCLVLDAHSNFHDDDRWAEQMIAWSQANPTHLGCAISVQLDCDIRNTDDEKMDMATRKLWDEQTGVAYMTGRSRYWGARLDLFDICSNGRFTIFPSKWYGVAKEAAQAGRPGIIQTILGGAYVLNREWYMEGLGRPWANNLGWGTSEQTISIPNWLLGGESVLLPIEVGHMYRTGKQATVPYRTHWAHIYYNQMKLAWSLPVPDELLQQLVAWISKNKNFSQAIRGMTMELLGVAEPHKYKAYLAKAPRTWDEYVARFELPTEVPDSEKLMDDRRAGR